MSLVKILVDFPVRGSIPIEVEASRVPTIGEFMSVENSYGSNLVKVCSVLHCPKQQGQFSLWNHVARVAVSFADSGDYISTMRVF